MSWKLSTVASRNAVENALNARDERGDWDESIVLTGFEVDPEEPDTWRLDAYVEGKPTDAQRSAVRSLFDGSPPRILAERLPETDWVSESQKGVEPIRAGRFRVRTPDHPPLNEDGVTEFCIPAAQAFGTGQHETTAGCLAMLGTMKRRGVLPRQVADIGTGTGLLAFAALDLWPAACATASDIDPLCLPAVNSNARLNSVALGTLPGQLAMVIAEGMDHPLLQGRAPYDLLIANILAGPLMALAPDFAEAVAPQGHVLLAGLLQTQESAVRRTYMRSGFRVEDRLVNGHWSILWLRKRFGR